MESRFDFWQRADKQQTYKFIDIRWLIEGSVMNLEYTWTQDLEIGISTVDEEHKEILGLIQFLTLCNGHPSEISDV